MKPIKSSKLMVLFINKYVQDPVEYIIRARLIDQDKDEILIYICVPIRLHEQDFWMFLLFENTSIFITSVSNVKILFNIIA